LGAAAIRPFKRRRYHRSSSSLWGDSTTTTALELLCCQQRQPLTTSCISSDVCNLLDEPGEQQIEIPSSLHGLGFRVFNDTCVSICHVWREGDTHFFCNLYVVVCICMDKSVSGWFCLWCIYSRSSCRRDLNHVVVHLSWIVSLWLIFVFHLYIYTHHHHHAEEMNLWS
jgi:hypothetical protein